MASCVKTPWGASSFRTLHGGVKLGGLEKQHVSSGKDPIVDANHETMGLVIMGNLQHSGTTG